MLSKFSLKWFIFLGLFALSLSVFGQGNKDAESSGKSLLTESDLPSGAILISDENMPDEVKAVLVSADLKFSKDNMEAFSWKNSSESKQLIEKIENNFGSAGWKHEVINGDGTKNTYFSLTKSNPKDRKLIGFFMPLDNALFLIIAESLSKKEKTSKGVDVTGKWDMIAQTEDQYIPVTLELKQTGDTVTGTFSSHIGNGTIQDIKVTGNELNAIAKVKVQDQIVEITLEGLIEGDKMSGTLSAEGLPTIDFEATKAK